MTKLCTQCRKPVSGGRNKYCSDACSDTASRGRIKVKKAAARSQRKRS